MNEPMRILLVRLALAITLVFAWEYFATAYKLTFYISRPSDVYARMIRWIGDGTLATHLFVTLYVAIAGFLLGSLAGLGVGLVCLIPS
jgi:NitT/TauT family transport system permease protein